MLKFTNDGYAVLAEEAITEGIVFIVQRTNDGNAIQAPAYKKDGVYYSNADATKGQPLHKLSGSELAALQSVGIDFEIVR